MPCPPLVVIAGLQILGRDAACESPCRAIHPEIPLCGIAGLRPACHNVNIGIAPRRRVATRYDPRYNSNGAQ
jgi:hypothetical protein